MTVSSVRWMAEVRELGCVICHKLGLGDTPAEVHHVAEGSGLRSDYSVCPLCAEHHRGGAGLHGMGTKAFCALYRIPGEDEWGLLVMTNELLARKWTHG